MQRSVTGKREESVQLSQSITLFLFPLLNAWNETSGEFCALLKE